MSKIQCKILYSIQFRVNFGFKINFKFFFNVELNM